MIDETDDYEDGMDLTLSPSEGLRPSDLLSFTAFWHFRLKRLPDRIHLAQSGHRNRPKKQIYFCPRLIAKSYGNASDIMTSCSSTQMSRQCLPYSMGGTLSIFVKFT